jgi:ribosomal protein S5
VPLAIEKANKEARANMIKVNRVGDTIAHEGLGRHGAARVLLLPATPGTGVKAGGTVRAILQVLGVRNVLSKIFGNTNPINVAKATMKALQQMQSVAEVERLRGVKLQMFHPQIGEQRTVQGVTGIAKARAIAQAAAADKAAAAADRSEEAAVGSDE